jgi:hypothetical protein
MKRPRVDVDTAKTTIRARTTVAIASASAIAFALGTFTACTIDYQLDQPIERLPLAVQRPLDILFVVDNSASMADEQATLLRSVFDPRCPITDVQAVPQRYNRPSREVFAELSEVCGIAQLLAAMGGDFHIGVITTDVGVCDERFSVGQDPNNLHEPTTMRGCLQGQGVITNSDDVEAAFQSAILGVGNYGSSIERGLDAMEVFLDPGSRRAPGCENDLDGFLRKDGRLMVVMVADEDDCSHRDGALGFPNELEGEPETCGEFIDLFARPETSASNCQNRQDQLVSVGAYSDALRGLVDTGRTTDVMVSVMGGLRDNGAGLEPGGCAPLPDGGVDGSCRATLGTAQTCDVEENCCSADGAFRYVEFARAVNADSLLGSICADNFRDPLLPLFFLDRLGGEEVLE